MTIRITGQTFPYKEEFKDRGGRWNSAANAWEFWDGTNVDRWRGKLGLVISGGSTAPKPERERLPMIDFAKIIRDRDEQRIGNSAPAVHGNDITYLNAFSSKNPPMFAGFSSLPDLVDFVEAIDPAISQQEAGNRNSGWRESEGKTTFTGTPNMQAAIDLARNGWSEGVAMAAEAAEIIAGDHVQQRARKYSVAGGRVNVGRMLSGNPLHMVSRPRQDGAKVITLFVQCFMSAAITAENAIIRAATVAAISDVLASNGYSSEIVAVGTSTAGRFSGLGSQIATVVKQAGEPLNIENVAYALGHPSFFRRLYFAVNAVEQRMQPIWPGMGGPLHAFDPEDLPPASHYIPRLDMRDQELVKGSTFKERVRSMFPLIKPEGLKIELT